MRGNSLAIQSLFIGFYGTHEVRVFRVTEEYAALEAFREALSLQPRNISYALNTAQSLLRLLLTAPDDALLTECRACLAQVRSLPTSDPRHERYRKLLERVDSL